MENVLAGVSIFMQLLQISKCFTGTALQTTTEQTPEEKNKRNWFGSSSDCCLQSNTLYDKEIQNDKDNFNIFQEMSAQNFTEIFLNDKVFPGAWIIPAGLFIES